MILIYLVSCSHTGLVIGKGILIQDWICQGHYRRIHIRVGKMDIMSLEENLVTETGHLNKRENMYKHRRRWCE